MGIRSNFENMPEIDAPSARTLVLDLLDAGDPADFSTRELVKAGAAFGIEPTGIRTALTRLTREQRVCVLERGRYAIGTKAEPIQKRVMQWESVEQRRKPWDGGWLIVIVGPAERADRTVWRRTQRAFDIEGFVEAETNVWVRPDNLVGGADGARARLSDFEAGVSLLVVEARGIDAARSTSFRGLWPVEMLAHSYADYGARLRASRERLALMPIDKAVAEALVAGREAIRMIVRDPLLPEDICPPAPLRGLIAEMRAYNAVGTALWRRYLAPAGAAT